MTPRSLVLVVVTCLAAVGLAGCLGDPSPVYVPEEVVPEGWSHETENQTQEEASGRVSIVLNHYVFSDHLVAEVFLVGVTDVPFVNERELLREQIDAETDGADVKVERTGESSMTLDNGRTVDRVEYDVTKRTATGEVRGKAWQISFDTGDFIGGGFGYATTEYQGLLGSSSDQTQWENVQRMLRAADW